VADAPRTKKAPTPKANTPGTILQEAWNVRTMMIPTATHARPMPNSTRGEDGRLPTWPGVFGVTGGRGPGRSAGSFGGVTRPRLRLSLATPRTVPARIRVSR